MMCTFSLFTISQLQMNQPNAQWSTIRTPAAPRRAVADVLPLWPVLQHQLPLRAAQQCRDFGMFCRCKDNP